MIIIDSHLDLAMNALSWNRDLTQSVFSLHEKVLHAFRKNEVV